MNKMSNHRSNRAPRAWQLLVALTASALSASAALAIHPGQWVHSTEADFEPGTTDNTVVTNLGDVKLATRTQVIGQMPEQASIIYDLQVLPNGDTYLAAGPEAKLLRREGDKIEEVLSLKDEQVFTLGQYKDKLLVGVSGAKSRLATLEGKELKTLVEFDKDVRYVWDVIVQGDDLIVATGTEGKVLRVRPGEKPDKHVTLLDASQANILCLGTDAQNRIYAGTDTDGLVYRITTKGKETQTFVMYDAREPEIGALLVMPDGTVYAGTADAKQARPGRLEKAVNAEEGRPEVPKEAPKQGELPNVPPKPKPKDGDKPAANPKNPAPNPKKPVKGENPPAADPSKPNAGKADPAPSKPDAKAPDAKAAPATNQPAPTPLADAPKDAPAAAPAPAPAEPAPPTPEQRDQLRQEIRRRLQDARQSGSLQAGPGTMAPPSRTSARVSSSTGRPSHAAQPPKQGNAIYRIDPSGFVQEVFRESVMILKIVDAGGSLLVATGNEGQLFRVDPQREETTIIADLEPQQIPAVLQGPGGQILLGTANPATLVSLDEAFAPKGTFTSQSLDASQISLWGKLHLTADVPKGAKVSVQTRSGNVEDPDEAAWSGWSKPIVLNHDPKAQELAPIEVAIGCPPARFLQYRLAFEGDGKATGSVHRVELAYVVPNMKPVVASIKATYPNVPSGGSSSGGPGGSRPSSGGSAAAEPQPQSKLNIQWEASDPNKDALTYTLQYRAAGSSIWLPLAEDLTPNRYDWETRRVPDGRYVLHVIASDAPDNTPAMALSTTRQSDPIVIDNTPPALAGVQVKMDNGGATITGSARDALSEIQSIRYAVDSTEDWQPVLPDDLIFDSTSESFTVKIAHLAPGPHVVTLRAADELGNAVYQAVQVEKK